MSAHHPLRVALAGNPNSGKSSLFNALTGARQHVANSIWLIGESGLDITNYGCHG
jgi:ribosome biogenesis GTPase A